MPAHRKHTACTALSELEELDLYYGVGWGGLGGGGGQKGMSCAVVTLHDYEGTFQQVDCLKKQISAHRRVIS